MSMLLNSFILESAGGGGVAATGGTKTTSGLYTIHTFTGSGTFTVTSGGDVDALIIAGGGGGGSNINGGGGGGGAGGMLEPSEHAVTVQDYTITVGAGGVANAVGNDSTFDTFTSDGGGKGAYFGIDGGDGGSGGGPAYGTSSPGDGTSGQGNDGATNSYAISTPYPGGGGGGSVVYSGGGGGGGGGGRVAPIADLTCDGCDPN